MIQVAVNNFSGKKTKDIELSEALFALPSNDVLLHQVYVALTANERQTIAHTKDRSERAGSGKKPWKQKGTGRARVGEVRNPVWRKGGVVFGPRKEENYGKDTNKKMRQKAVMIALAEKIRSGKLIVLETLEFPEMKTKSFIETRTALGVDNKSVVVAFSQDEFGSAKAVRNAERTKNTLAVNLNVVELLNCEYIMTSVAGIDALTKRFSAWEK
jgi:large subunit ribosomal protein L4